MAAESAAGGSLVPVAGISRLSAGRIAEEQRVKRTHEEMNLDSADDASEADLAGELMKHFDVLGDPQEKNKHFCCKVCRHTFKGSGMSKVKEHILRDPFSVGVSANVVLCSAPHPDLKARLLRLYTEENRQAMAKKKIACEKKKKTRILVVLKWHRRLLWGKSCKTCRKKMQSVQ